MASASTSSDASVTNSTKKPTIGDGHATGDVAATGAFASRAKQALDAWQTLEKALANISSHQKTFSEVAEAVNRHLGTDIELQQKDAQIARLQSTMETISDEFAKRYNQWDIDREELKGELERKDTASEAKLKVLKHNFTASHAQEVETFKKALESEKKKSAALEAKLEDANIKIEKIEDELVKCRDEVEDWNDYVSDLKDVDFGKFKIKPLFDRCCTLARNHFLRDLPEGAFMSEWDKVIGNLEVRLCFPPSNSEVAKRVRMAACLHIVARSLCTNIFKPCYIPYSSSFSDGLKDILATQFRTDPEKERITRALILSTYLEEEVTTAISLTARASANEIRILLNPLGATDKFAKELEKIFFDAGELWKNFAQHSDKMVEALTEDDVSDVSWEIMNEFTMQNTNTTTTTTAADTDKDPSQSNVLNLFPCIFVPEDDNVLFSGVRLIDSQGIMSAADEEFSAYTVARRQRNLRSTTGGFSGGHPTRGRERRMSSFGEGRGGILANSSAAAVAGDEATQQQRSKNGNK